MPDEEVGNLKDDSEAPREAEVRTEEAPPTEPEPSARPEVDEEPAEVPSEAPAEAGADEADVDALAVAQARIEAAERAATHHLDRLRRLQAEFDNFRKRVRREQEEEKKRASERLITELLPVLDSFERALTDPGDRDSLLDGLKLIQKQLTHTLTLQGLERVEAVGTPFDPTRHEALAREPSAEHPEDTVLREFEPGYALHGRVLRPARVVVAAPAPATAEPAPEQQAEGAEERKAQEPEATKPMRESGVAPEGDHSEQ